MKIEKMIVCKDMNDNTVKISYRVLFKKFYWLTHKYTPFKGKGWHCSGGGTPFIGFSVTCDGKKTIKKVIQSNWSQNPKGNIRYISYDEKIGRWNRKRKEVESNE